MVNKVSFKQVSALVLAISVLMALGISCSVPDSIRKQRVRSPRGDYVKTPTRQRKVSKPYRVMGKKYYPLASADGFTQKGVASWYGPKFHGKLTANGETYDQMDMTAAHKTLPFNTVLIVHSYDNGREITVRVNDRGPFVGTRIIDLSKKAATKLGMIGTGTARVKLTAITDGATGRRTGERRRFGKGVAFDRPKLPPPPFTSKVIQPVKEEPAQPELRESFWVQLGSFSKRENAESFKEKISGQFAGAKVRSKRFYTGEVYRVHFGPFSSKDAAQRALRRVKDAGASGAFMVAEP